MVEVATVIVFVWLASCVCRTMTAGVVVPVILVNTMSLVALEAGSVNTTEEDSVVVPVTFAELNEEP